MGTFEAIDSCNIDAYKRSELSEPNTNLTQCKALVKLVKKFKLSIAE